MAEVKEAVKAMSREEAIPVIYGHLVKKAIARETTTYGDLARLVGLPECGNHMSNTLANYLLAILEWSKLRGQPPITSIVVKAAKGPEQGIPGKGFWPAAGFGEITLQQKRLFTQQYHKWVFDFYAML